MAFFELDAVSAAGCAVNDILWENLNCTECVIDFVPELP